MGARCIFYFRSESRNLQRVHENRPHEKGKDKDYALYWYGRIAAPKIIIGEERHISKGVSANVDFYSPDLCTACWIFRPSCSHQCLPLHGSSAGVFTDGAV